MVHKKITVLFVSHNDELNGAERSLLTLVSRLKSQGNIEPYVLVPGGGSLVAELKKHDIEVIQAAYHHWLGKSFFNRLLKGPVRLVCNLIQLVFLQKTIKKIKPQLIYINTISNPFGAFIALFFQLPCVWHLREFVHEDMGRKFDLGTYITTRLINKAKIIICNSQAVRNKWEKHLQSDKLVVIYNGFNFVETNENAHEKFQRCVNTQPIILSIIGTISPHKGQKDAINALSILINKGYQIQLYLIGTGREEYLSELKVISNRLGINECIQWEGFVSNANTYYHKTAVTLVCSRCEAFGRVAVESMGIGTPVVVSKTGGLPEIVNVKGNELLGQQYNYGDYNELADKVDELLSDEQRYVYYSAKGRQSVVERFNVEQYISQIETLLLKINTEK